MIEDTKTQEEFLTPETFYTLIVKLMREKSINHLDAVTEYCSINSIDIEEIIPLITRPLKDKIHVDAMESGLMKKESSLPI